MTRKSRKKSNIEDELMYNNIKAIHDGPLKKRWSIHDLRHIKPLTDTQETLFRLFFDDYNICAYGSPGTGKTFLGLYLAFNEVLSGNHDRIIIVRSAVATRDVGFLPGTLDEKMALYETPYRDICSELFGRKSTYNDMKMAGKIEFMPTSFIRGVTWDNAVVVVDEGQNMTEHEINSIMTRIGKNARVIFTGDISQTDLRKNSKDVSGMAKMVRVMERMDEFECVNFLRDDIVRSTFVKNWIISLEDTT